MRATIRDLPRQCRVGWLEAQAFDLPADYGEIGKVVILGDRPGGTPATANNNIVRDCIIRSGVQSDGIELVDGNLVTSTASYGLYIVSSLCHDTVVCSNNSFTGALGAIRNLGTNTQLVNC